MNTIFLRGCFAALLFALIFSFVADSPAQNAGEIKKLPPAHFVRSRDYDVRHIALDLKFDWEKEQTFGTATITLAPLAPDVKKINLDAGLMTINSVKMNGKDLTFNYDGKNTLLSVNLDRVYRINEPLTFVVDYRTTGEIVENTLGFGGGGGLKFIKPTADNPNRRRQIWSQGESDYNRFWFPSYDSPNDFRTSELRATVEKPMFVVSNGRLVETKENSDNSRTFHWKMDVPYANYLTSVVVGEYAEIKGEYQGIPVSTFIFPNEEKDGAASVQKLPAMVKFFSEKTGVKYPYAKYAQTMAEGFSGGMENITATTMTPTMIHDARELLDDDSESLQSHELAHQWFGDFVTTREWAHIWLNESFATYFQALWHENSKGHDYFLYADVRGNQQAYLNTWNQGQRRPIVTRYYPNADALFDTYAYPRGGAVLHMLKKHLGDEMFFKAINHYLTTNANKPVETEQLRIAIEESTGQSMDWFFDQWLYKMGHPVFEVTQNYDSAAKKLTLTVKQTQKIDRNNEYPQAEFFRGWIDIEIDDRSERVWIEPQAENAFVFDAATKPLLVDFDNESTWIKELRFDKTTDELLYQMRQDKDVIGRLTAMNQLTARAKTPANAADKSRIVAALNQTIAADPFWAIRRDAVRAVYSLDGIPQDGGAVKLDAATIGVLKNAVKDQKSLVRAAAVEGLSLTNETGNADIFLAALDDPSYTVIESAAVGLARTKDARAFDALSKLADTNSWHDRIRSAGLQGLSLLGDQRAVTLGFRYADKSYSPVVQSNALGVLAASSKGDARVYPLLIASFKKALENREFQAIFNGLQSFIKLADPRGQEAFDLAKAQFKDQKNILGFVNQMETQFKKAIAQK